MGADFPASKPSQELLDVVRIATAAHRPAVGNFIWYGWDGAKTKGGDRSQHMACSSSASLLLSPPAFCRILASQPPSHLDIILRTWLLEDEAQHEVAASFDTPAAGATSRM